MHQLHNAKLNVKVTNNVWETIAMAAGAKDTDPCARTAQRPRFELRQRGDQYSQNTAEFSFHDFVQCVLCQLWSNLQSTRALCAQQVYDPLVTMSTEHFI